MDDTFSRPTTRRDFLKKTVVVAGAATLPEFITGCASLSQIDRLNIDYSRDIILNNCKIVDPGTGTVRSGASLRVSHGKIVAVGERSRRRRSVLRCV